MGTNDGSGGHEKSCQILWRIPQSTAVGQHSKMFAGGPIKSSGNPQPDSPAPATAVFQFLFSGARSLLQKKKKNPFA